MFLPLTSWHCISVTLTCVLEPERDPPPPPPTACIPSCGANAECKVVGNRGTCACLDGFHGRPELGCTPECVTTLDCEHDRACVNQRCIDPCPGACGSGAKCRVLHHNPLCSCPEGMVGDPFAVCLPAPGMLSAVSSPYHPFDIDNKFDVYLGTPPFNDGLLKQFANSFQLHLQSLSCHASLVHAAAMLSAHHQAAMLCAPV